ncbi:protein kinase [Streptomyces microflavus]|uniref:protein kinase domain-containing protein n=1 Tax=Streptomyces microflavus TaxID=1919 RepID=UPI00369E8A79
MSTEPREIPKALLDRFRPSTSTQIVDRRGSTVWKITIPAGKFALKVGYPIAETPDWPAQEWTALAPAREAFVLNTLHRTPVAYGQWDEGTWNCQPWQEGKNLYDLWERHRSILTLPRSEEIVQCCEAIDYLHKNGWVHGDIQPAHLITGDELNPHASLIDLALARGRPVFDRFDFPYRGCLVHYEAPEISEAVLSGGLITPTKASDVYAFGASLLMSVTGQRHVEYPDDADRADQRRAIVAKNHRSIKVGGAWGPLIAAMMQRDPDERPSVRDVAIEVASWST